MSLTLTRLHLMKYFLLVLASFSLIACRPVHVTKTYYDEYINPTASIDYDDTITTNLPDIFIDNYYSIDSNLARIVNQLDLSESTISESWIYQQKTENSWIKSAATWDKDILYISGDDTLGFDPLARRVAADSFEIKGSIIAHDENRFFLVHTTSDGNASQRLAIVEFDITAMLENLDQSVISLAINGQPLDAGAAQYAEIVAKAASSTKYSGSKRQDGQTVYWIRSMAADNLIYLYSN